jgi:predicted Zn-dependent protease
LKACQKASQVKIKMTFKLRTTGFVLLLTCGILFASQRVLEPKIPPGYKPAETETELGVWMELQDYEKKIRRSALLVKDRQLNAYVKNAACRVAGDYCNDLRIYIIRNPYFNASMTANGVMQVWTGLLVRVSSEDELAAVLGHELAHYTQLHTLERLRSLKDSMTTGSMLDFGLILLTGLPLPVGQLAAVANVMAFSREQEEEADLLGVQFMAQAGYDPSAAVRVWKMIVEEEENAAVKSGEPGFFSKTHPSTDDRIEILEAFIKEEYQEFSPNPEGQQRHVEILNQHYMMLMEDQLDTNRFGRTGAMLSDHQKIGVDANLIDFFRGEMYRQRNEENDLKQAKESYLRAVQGEKPVAEAYHNLGYIYLKEGSLPEAKYNFTKYLELKPDTDDRAMIEFYLQETRP